MSTRRRWGSLGLLVLTWVVVAAQPAAAAVPHVVQDGETMWSIAAGNGFTTRTVAVFNGLPEDAALVAGQTIEIPTEAEGAAALQSAGLLGTDPAATSTTEAAPTETSPATGTEPAPPATSSAAATTTEAGVPLAHIPSPSGELHLEAGAARAWNAMREEALRTYGIDIYPGGPLSAYRTSEEQRYLYELYLAGEGAPANPPGTSSHELGLSVDLATPEMRAIVDDIGPSFGWGKTESPDEWWHVTYTGG